MTLSEPANLEEATNAGGASTVRGLLRNGTILRLLITALLAEIAYAVLNISTMPVYLRDERHFGTTVVGIVLVAFLLSEAAFKGYMGHLADRYGCRRLMVAGPLLSVLTSLASVAAPRNVGILEPLIFIGLRILDGIGAAMLWPAVFASMSEAAPDKQRQQALSLLNNCYLLGVALALPVGGAVNDLVGVKHASLYLACGMFAAVSLSARGLPTARAQHHEGEHSAGFSLEAIRVIPAYLLIAVVTFAGIGFPMAVIKLFAQDQFNMSESAFGGLAFPAAILMAAMGLPLARYGDRIGRKRAVHTGLMLCSVGMLVIASGALLPVMRGAWVIAAGGIPVGFGFLLTIPAWMATVADVDPSKRAAYLGAVMTAQGVGAIIGAPLGGWAYQTLPSVGKALHLGEAFGRYSPFMGCAACVTAGWLLSLRVIRE